jgi:photosystem II stability/assembly factor-like uncharacterized protein
MKSLSVKNISENFWVAGWQYMPDGEVKLLRQNGLSLYFSTSKDNLVTWSKDDIPGAYSPYWFDATHGLSLKTSPGMVMVDSKLQKTNDGGRTWTVHGNPLETKNYAGQIVFADEQEVLIQGGNMLYSTTDGGSTWRRLFPQEVK